MADDPIFKGVISDRPKVVINRPDRNFPTIQDLWTRVDNDRAGDEGWCITYTNPWVITTIGVKFTSAEDAQRWVGEKADAGSEFHIRALATVMALNIKGLSLWEMQIEAAIRR